jgi:hypothetical protein
MELRTASAAQLISLRKQNALFRSFFPFIYFPKPQFYLQLYNKCYLIQDGKIERGKHFYCLKKKVQSKAVLFRGHATMHNATIP